MAYKNLALAALLMVISHACRSVADPTNYPAIHYIALATLLPSKPTHPILTVMKSAAIEEQGSFVLAKAAATVVAGLLAASKAARRFSAKASSSSSDVMLRIDVNTFAPNPPRQAILRPKHQAILGPWWNQAIMGQNIAQCGQHMRRAQWCDVSV